MFRISFTDVSKDKSRNQYLEYMKKLDPRNRSRSVFIEKNKKSKADKLLI